MNFLENDLEQIIMQSENQKLNNRGLLIKGFKRNQVRIGNYGIADIVTYERQNFELPRITIYELKKDKVSLSTFAQGIHYVKGVQEYFKFIGKNICDYNWSLVLVGKKVEKNTCICYLPDLFKNEYDESVSINIYEYNYNIDGISFNAVNGYSLVDNGFVYNF